MHKRMVNQAIIELTISPVGPLLIKASDQGADPTKPDMEFVETYHAGGRSVYLPGSSLKGAIRAHCERIVRTIGGNVTACDPLKQNASCRKLKERYGENTAAIHKHSCTVCQIFGSTDIAAHARIADAYPISPKEIQREERNGVAIDRVYGSVAVGPFNFEVLTSGEFTTKITVKNFTTVQLALIALAIRDFDEQRVGIGFAKSRGLGQVNMKVNRVAIHYPTAVVEDKQVRPIGNQTDPFSDNAVIGAGQLVNDAEAYGFPNPDSVNVNVQAQPDDYGFGATLSFQESDDITQLWRECVGSWRNMIEGEQ
ncbi:CRISPR-associated protein [Candidatus Poribacteria bacterium]|nr:MAG: CRISPR-associated protein [Candidatus Poribacteria bacterium]